MSSPTFQVTLDCADPDRLATFWCEALGYRKDPPPDGYATWDAWLDEQGVPDDGRNDFSAASDPDGVRPRLFFQRVPEPKTVKNRVHLDVNAGAGAPDDAERRRLVRAAAARLVAAGATTVRECEQYGDWWIVMADPEGNEFCVQ